MISIKHKCIFIEVPKTGSTSIRSIIGEPDKPHLDIREIRNKLEKGDILEKPADSIVNKLYKLALPGSLRRHYGKGIFNNFFKFGIVRNPWSRTVSLYFRNEGEQYRSKMTFEDFVHWIKYSSDTCIHPSKKRNQLDWFTDQQGRVLVDFIGKFERLGEDWKWLADKLGVESELPRKKRNRRKPRKHYTEFYNSETRELIYTKFRTDIDYFGYSFGE